MAIDQRSAPRQLTDLGKELARPLIDDRRDPAEAVALGNGHMAGQHDKHAEPWLAGLEQGFAVVIVAFLAEPAHPRDFLRSQGRESLFVTRKGVGEARGARFLSHDGFVRHYQPPYPANPRDRGVSSTGIREPAYVSQPAIYPGFLRRCRRKPHQRRTTPA